jgi:hypothetical protein
MYEADSYSSVDTVYSGISFTIILESSFRFDIFKLCSFQITFPCQKFLNNAIYCVKPKRSFWSLDYISSYCCLCKSLRAV